MSSVSEDIEPVDGGPVTLINAFEVPVERIDTFIAQWRERAKIMSAAPVFPRLAAAPCPLLSHALPDRQRRPLLGQPTGVGSRRGEPGVSSPPACSGRRHRSADLRELKALCRVVVDYGDLQQP
jgi:hypothetical protein